MTDNLTRSLTLSHNANEIEKFLQKRPVNEHPQAIPLLLESREVIDELLADLIWDVEGGDISDPLSYEDIIAVIRIVRERMERARSK